jgi:hypothetical protein
MPAWTIEQLRQTKAGEAFLNAIRPVETTKRKRRANAALVRQSPRRKSGQGSVAVVITLIAARHRLIDDDNSVAGLKPCRDAIARSLGIDDADQRVRWCYGQTRTDGAEGVIVRIENL